MKEQFFELVTARSGELRGNEILLANLAQESSEFVRWNGGRIRQAGTVEQAYLSLDLVDGDRSAGTVLTLTGGVEVDTVRTRQAIEVLRERLGTVPPDPHLAYAREVHSTETLGTDTLPAKEQVLAEVEAAAQGTDFVGSYAAGPMRFGFANSLGQRNWAERFSFLLDYSVFHVADRAVKNSYSGFAWDGAELRRAVDQSRAELEIMKREPRTVAPGKYRVFLAPAAVQEFLGTLSWGGFGVYAHRKKHASLLRLSEGEAQLDPRVTITENTLDGVAPGFQHEGFVKPDRVVLVEGGRFGQPLVSPRSAREFGVPANGANGMEAPESIELAPGGLSRDEVLSRLGEGLYVSNLWYMNYSDRPACRMTGMTRFATFWVEGGEIVAPVSVMRFDESAYRVLGSELEDLTRERELRVVPDSYGSRSTDSFRVPGILLRSFEFTL